MSDECRLCEGGKLVSKPCGVSHKYSAANLPQRPRYPAKWECKACGCEDIFHGGDNPSELECSECACGAFDPGEIDRGSECTACGYKVAWNCTLPGVVQGCDKCGAKDTLVLFGDLPSAKPEPKKKRGRGRPKKVYSFNDVDDKLAIKKQRSNCVECGKPIRAGQKFREANKQKVHLSCMWS